MKNIWERPLTVVQRFDANEAISACGDGGKVITFSALLAAVNMAEFGKRQMESPASR